MSSIPPNLTELVDEEGLPDTLPPPAPATLDDLVLALYAADDVLAAVPPMPSREELILGRGDPNWNRRACACADVTRAEKALLAAVRDRRPR